MRGYDTKKSGTAEVEALSSLACAGDGRAFFVCSRMINSFEEEIK